MSTTELASVAPARASVAATIRRTWRRPTVAANPALPRTAPVKATTSAASMSSVPVEIAIACLSPLIDHDRRR